MMKCSTLVYLLMAVAAAAGLFLMKYEMRALEEQLAGLNRDIVRKQEALHVLRAEWSHLNQPVRLERLGRTLLRLEPMMPGQAGRISDIPLRMEAAPAVQAQGAGTRIVPRIVPRLASMKPAR